MKLHRNKITWTTLITQQRDMGKVANMKSRETKVMKWAHRPGPSSQLADFIQKYVVINKTQASVALCQGCRRFLTISDLR